MEQRRRLPIFPTTRHRPIRYPRRSRNWQNSRTKSANWQLSRRQTRHRDAIRQNRRGSGGNPPSSQAPTEKGAHFRQHWAGHMCPSCFFLRCHSDLRQLYLKSRPGVSSERKARPAAVIPHLSIGDTPSSTPRGSPMNGSVYDTVPPSSRGSPQPNQRDARSDGRRSAPMSKPTKPSTNPAKSPRPVDSADTRPGASPPVSGGEDRAPRVLSNAPTRQAYNEAAARDAYYRQSLFQMGRSNAERNVHRNATGSSRGAPPSRCAPLAEARRRHGQMIQLPRNAHS